jgi:hypothetical protein
MITLSFRPSPWHQLCPKYIKRELKNAVFISFYFLPSNKPGGRKRGKAQS